MERSPSLVTKKKPVYLMCQEGVTETQMSAIREAVQALLTMAEVGDQVPVKNFGVWRQPDYLQEGSLVPHKSVDWYLQRAREESKRLPRQINAMAIIDALRVDPWNFERPHYDLMVARDDMYDGNPGINFVIGLALRERATIVSTARFLQLPEELQVELIKTEIMHEIGHVFGLPPEDRTHHIEESLGRHCTERCVIRQGLRVPQDWIRMTQDRLQHGALCTHCTQDLKRFFNA